MNIQEIMQNLQNTQAKLDNANIDDNSKIDLDILVLQLKKALQTAVFDPLKDIDSVTVADTLQLMSLTGQLDGVIADENKRVALVEQVVGVAKTALKAAGLSL